MLQNTVKNLGKMLQEQMKNTEKCNYEVELAGV